MGRRDRRRQAHRARRPSSRGCWPRSRSAAGRRPKRARPRPTLADPRTVVIITGQQAGLFGGPLFTLLKALTAIKLAEQVSRDHGVTVVPVFWIDAEDHDWPEVSSCTVLDGDFGAAHDHARRSLPGAGDLPIARLTLDDQIDAAIDALRSGPAGHRVHADAPRRRPRAPIARAAAWPTRSAGWSRSLLGPHGLVVFDSSDPAAKPLARHVFARELAQPGETAQLAARAGQALVAAGYHAQVTPPDGAVVALLSQRRARQHPRSPDDRATVGERETTLAALLEEVERSPEHFSPNVLLRPIVQDTLFPTICYVAGPNELAYLGQLRRRLRALRRADAADVPARDRHASSIRRRCASSASTSCRSKRCSRRTKRRSINCCRISCRRPSKQSLTQRVDARSRSAWRDVAAAVPQIDPTLEGTVQSTLTACSTICRRCTTRSSRRRSGGTRRCAGSSSARRRSRFPTAIRRSARSAFVWFLNRYGPALVDRLLEDLPLDMGHHWVLDLIRTARLSR